MKTNEKPSVAAMLMAVVVAAAPAAAAAGAAAGFALESFVPEGSGLGVVLAAVVALALGLGVSQQRLPLWGVLAVWAPLLMALGLADGIMKEGVLSTSMAAAMDRPALFTAFSIQALALVSTGALLTCGLGSGLSVVLGRHAERLGALVAMEAAVVVGGVVGMMAFARALQLDGLNADGAYLAGANLGANLLRVAPLLGGAVLVQGLVKAGRWMAAGERGGLVPGLVVAAVGIAGVAGSVGLTADLGAAAATFPGLTLPDGVTALEIEAGARPRGIVGVCTSDGLRKGDGAGQGGIVVDSSAGPAGLAACLAAVGTATEVEFVGRRRLGHIVTDEALAPFTVAPRYASVVVPRCKDGDGNTPVSATTDPALLFTDAVCFVPSAG